MEDKEHTADYSNDTWLSLLGLLHPSEFFVTVDHSNVWLKHLAWSKADGKTLRNYTAQRFSSSMVFLSLILAAEMNVLFNSSVITTDIRTQMINGNYSSVKHWIGCVILLSAVITVIALVSTFTAWGMVSSIGDKNAHCLLRSSIGQLVTSLPSNYVVLSLYLFLIWLVLFIVELTTGPVQKILLLIVMILFFQTVVSLSAFGRLILHTGAMGSRPVLDPSLEKALLPSGLHASLLIKATDRKRRQTSVTSMYRTPKRNNRAASPSVSHSGDSCRGRDTMHVGGGLPRLSSLTSSFITKPEGGGSAMRKASKQSILPIDVDIENGSRHSADRNHSPTWPGASASTCSSTAGTQQHSVTTDEEIAIREAARVMTPRGQTPRSDGSLSSSFSNPHEREHLLNEQMPGYGLESNGNNLLYDNSFHSHEYHESFGSMVSFPRPSILNSSIAGSDLKKLVEDCCSTSSNRNEKLDNSCSNQTPLRRNGSRGMDKVRFSFRSATSDASSNMERQGSLRSFFGSTKPASRRSLLSGLRQASTRMSIRAEWDEEVDVRAYYGEEAPAEVVFDDGHHEIPQSDSEDDEAYDLDGDDVIMPRPSILNKTRRLKSLRRLASGSSADGNMESVDNRNESPPMVKEKSTQDSSNANARCDVEKGNVDEDDDALVGESIHLISSPNRKT